ncbi:MAG: TolC family protein [Deltaproteobacteria bacterium]|nr:TolC family protein [Deltaproteobacteria bacterium]
MALTLEEALKLALVQNKDIQKAKEFRNLVEGKYVEERAAALPQLTGRAGISRDRDESQAAFNRFFPVERETRNAGVGLNQVIYTFGQVEAAIRAAEIGLKTADDQLKISHQAVIKDVSSVFYDVLLAKELYRVAQENLEQKKRNHEESKKKFKLGVGTEFDVLVSQVAMENARPEVIRTANLIQQSRLRLAFQLGLSDERVDGRGSLEAPIGTYPMYEESIRTALSRRPELKEFRHRIGIAEEVVKINNAFDKPRLDFKAGYGWQDMILENTQADGPTWTLGLFLTYPFFDGLRARGKVAQSKSELTTLKIEEAKFIDSVILLVRDAVNRVKEAGEIVKGLTGTVTQAETLLALAEKGFQFGVKTRLEVEDAQLNQVQAKSDLARAKRDYLVALVNLDWNMGILQEPR